MSQFKVVVDLSHSPPIGIENTQVHVVGTWWLEPAEAQHLGQIMAEVVEYMLPKPTTATWDVATGMRERKNEEPLICDGGADPD